MARRWCYCCPVVLLFPILALVSTQVYSQQNTPSSDYDPLFSYSRHFTRQYSKHHQYAGSSLPLDEQYTPKWEPNNGLSPNRYSPNQQPESQYDSSSSSQARNKFGYPPIHDSDLITAPLTSARNKTILSLFSKWGADIKEVGPNPNSIESSLAAIFRGVAYGVSTAPTTTTQKPTSSLPPPVHVNSSVKVDDNGISLASNSNSDVEGNLKAVHHVDGPHRDGGSNVAVNSNPMVVASSATPTTTPTEVKRAGLENWQTELQGAWEVHIYCSAASFSLLALISLLCIVRVHLSNYLLPRGYYVTAHLLVFLASFFRCVLFFHDPYASCGKLPVALSDVLFNTGVPCVTAAFSVVVLALLNCARIVLLPLKLQNPQVFGLISCIYITSSVLVDVLAGVYAHFEWTGALKASIQALTAGWTAAMCLGYMIIFYRIEKASSRQRNELVRLSHTRENAENKAIPRQLPTLSLSRGARLILVASFCGLSVAVLQVYGLMTPDGLVQLPTKDPWMWFGYQTSCRLLEIIMWSCVCVAAALSSNSSLDKQNNEDQGLTVFSCKKCSSCSDMSSCQERNDEKSNDDLYPTVCQTNLAARHFSVDVNGRMICEDDRNFPIINSTVVPKERERNSRKSSTLHSGTSDMHLLCGGQYSNSAASRPASMIFNENGFVRFQDIQQENDTAEEIPPGYLEHGYNISNQRRPNYSLNDRTYSEAEDSPHLQQILQSRMAKQGCGRVLREIGPPNNEASDPVTEYSYSDIGTSLPNDEYGRYASACSSESAANSFDVKMYDDYEVAPYYHSSTIGPKSVASSHIYTSLHPSQVTAIPPQKNSRPRIAANYPFSSPQSGFSNTLSKYGSRQSNHHNSDSDLCSSATDRTQISSSQGNEEITGAFDDSNFQRNPMRRHLSHPNSIPNENTSRLEERNRIREETDCNETLADEARKLRRNIDSNYRLQNSDYSPTDSDDIYTPLMEHHLEKHLENSPSASREPQLTQVQLLLNQTENNLSMSPQSHKMVQLPESTKGAVPSNNPNFPMQNQMPSINMAVHNQKSPTFRPSPSSPIYIRSDTISNTETSKFGNNSSLISNDFFQNADYPNLVAFSRPPPPSIPQRPSPAETWVHQTRQGQAKTECLSKGGIKGNQGSQPITAIPSVNSPVTNI